MLTMSFKKLMYIDQADESCSESILGFVEHLNLSTRLLSSDDSWEPVWPGLLATGHV